MPYSVSIKRSAEKEIDDLPVGIFERVASAILELEAEPRPPGCVKLRGMDKFRIRVGSYRILYTIDDERLSVRVVAVGHRGDVYRK
ncbi:MAG: type II toxin-antitoxin system RelE/ParE family toxin [Candidatus Hydrogenedentes bacterium]|nr:type II toxin-antitoxin system RelE/ParE family toxin [Candidatus Hydrogenedentota bacterium]